jgi:prepilin-type N-terminal cleavage/methylation domain-containing protein
MNRRGVSLVELLVTVVISAIAIMALTVPFAVERSFWGVGRRQAEAQRDAQVALRAIARIARQNSIYTPTSINPNSSRIQFGGSAGCFQGGPAFNGQLQYYAAVCGTGTPTLVINGNAARSRITNIAFTTVTPNRLFLVTLTVTYNNRETEVLTTELYLRNAT